MLKALLWDVDGTLAETEHDGHLVAFNQAFEALGVPWRWSEARYAELLTITGGRERLVHDLRSQPSAPVDAVEHRALAESVYALKNARYARIVAEGSITLRSGVRELFDDCARAGVAMAIVTATSRTNLHALLTAHIGGDWPTRFAAVVCGEDVACKKPDPQAYALALRTLGLAAHETLAIEDSPAGVAAARASGIPVVVTRSRYFATAAVEGVLALGPSLGSGRCWQPAAAEPDGRIDLPQLTRWHGACAPRQGAR